MAALQSIQIESQKENPKNLDSIKRKVKRGKKEIIMVVNSAVESIVESGIHSHSKNLQSSENASDEDNYEYVTDLEDEEEVGDDDVLAESHEDDDEEDSDEEDCGFDEDRDLVEATDSVVDQIRIDNSIEMFSPMDGLGQGENDSPLEISDNSVPAFGNLADPSIATSLNYSKHDDDQSDIFPAFKPDISFVSDASEYDYGHIAGSGLQVAKALKEVQPDIR